MDFEISFRSIMTDAKVSKSSIAAKLQNAFSSTILPPIGVFWDIENCQVPKGKSALALVQRIREKFFANHREAEFMCVCDINKESKTVIQELILAQVTVVHISATSKNAADDKLKQCMRRFVDTHGSPSTLLLISDDVNFSSDLSDFRHRHNIRIILLHRGRAHQSLLACAHEYYEFSTIAFDLPFRSPVKTSDARLNELIVTDLPVKSAGQIRAQLRKLSQNCGGKVYQVKGNKAFIRFATAEAAERAQKRMDKEIVFGRQISVNFFYPSDQDFNYSLRKDYKGFESSNEASESSCCSRDSSRSPSRENEPTESFSSYPYQRKCDFPPPPVLDSDTLPSMLMQNNLLKDKNSHYDNPSLFPELSNIGHNKEHFHMDWNSKAQSNSQDMSAFSPFKKDSSRVKYSQKSVGRVSPFLKQDSNKTGSPIFSSQNESIRRCHSHLENPCMHLISNNNHTLQKVTSSFDVPRWSSISLSTPWSTALVSSEPSSLDVIKRIPTYNVIRNYVELQVSNLDPNYEINEMKRLLLSVFQEHVLVIHISMSLQPDGSAKATIKVPSLQDAQYAISRLHRKKIGHKRILISYVSSDKIPPFYVLKTETIELLNDIPNKNLPLIKFRELYEKRYHRPIAISELYKMKDIITIQGDSGSRVVYLNYEYCRTPSLPDIKDYEDVSLSEKPYCEFHFHISTSDGWAEQYSICPLPLVHISLKTLATAVHKLLDSHHGSLPLISFGDCYEAEIGPLPVIEICGGVSEKEGGSCSTFKCNKGVPLEHLIACISGIEVAKSIFCFKKVQWMKNKIEAQSPQTFSPALLGQLTLFGREVMDLLKNQPQCLVQFNKFIPTYHHHFGRQCRVADYGFTKLIDLLEAIPHIVQVLGEGQNRQVTLTHRTQVKRFATELLRILKSRASKQIAVSEFSQAYEQVIEKPFEITNYGVCEIEDMLDEVPENVVVTCNSGNEIIIAIPKREQTSEEVERTKQFADEVIELMKHTTNCSMAFNKFIPAYHHHFGKQCRVADYGFTKLIELFESIPSVLEVKGTGEDKILYLVEAKQHKILIERLSSVLKSQPDRRIDSSRMASAYAQLHGHSLRPCEFGFKNFTELIEKFNSHFKVVKEGDKSSIYLADHELFQQISLNVKLILMSEKNDVLSNREVIDLYEAHFGSIPTLDTYFQNIPGVMPIVGNLQLDPLHMLAKNILLLLRENGGHLQLNKLQTLFEQRFQNQINYTNYGFQDITALLQCLSNFFVIKGKKNKRIITLSSKVIDKLFILNSNKDEDFGLINPDELDEFYPCDAFNYERRESPDLNVPRNRESFPYTASAESSKLFYSNSQASASDQSSKHLYSYCQTNASSLTSNCMSHSMNPSKQSSDKPSRTSREHPTCSQRLSASNICSVISTSASHESKQMASDLWTSDHKTPPKQNVKRAIILNSFIVSDIDVQASKNSEQSQKIEPERTGSSSSTNSTPSKDNKLNRRPRIAAQFSLSIDG